MQQTRTLSIVVLCVFALCCADVVLAADSVMDSNGRVWCVRSAVSPAPVEGQEIYLYDAEETFGQFITMDRTVDETPHVFLTPTGKIGIVWSRKDGAAGRMEICSTVYDQVSGLCAYPFTILTSPPGNVDHTEPRMEMSPSGTAHLVYIATSVADGQTVSKLVYRIKQNGAWSEPHFVSDIDESVACPELYLGASDQGYPLVLVYLSSPKPVGSVLSKQQSNRGQTIKALAKDDSGPDPWLGLIKHLLPINLR